MGRAASRVNDEGPWLELPGQATLTSEQSQHVGGTRKREKDDRAIVGDLIDAHEPGATLDERLGQRGVEVVDQQLVSVDEAARDGRPHGSDPDESDGFTHHDSIHLTISIV